MMENKVDLFGRCAGTIVWEGDIVSSLDNCRVTSPELTHAMNKSALLDPQTYTAAQRFIAQLAPNYDLLGVVLFGSRARREHHPDSDADIAVLLRGRPQKRLPVRLAMSDVAFDVMLETGINISPLPLWMDDWEHPETFSNPALMHAIQREGIRL